MPNNLVSQSEQFREAAADDGSPWEHEVARIVAAMPDTGGGPPLYFGDTRLEGSSTVGQRVPVPTGLACAWCGEEISEADSGLVKLRIIAARQAVFDPYHLECTCRLDLGSLGHQRMRCPCFGGSEGDPHGMSRRQAARAALLEYQTYGRRFVRPSPCGSRN